MVSLKEVSTSRAPEDYLRMALQAQSPKQRARMAQLGLDALDGGESALDTEVLLLRQLYLAHLESERFAQAADVALRMARLGPLKDVAHHDAARALQALGDLEGAVAQQRLAARASPPERRSFHYWSLGTLLQVSGDWRGAVAALERGERWAHVDRPLLKAHRAWIRLEAGQAVRGLDVIANELERARCREGYGQFVLGMLRHAMGDHRRAAVHLRAFLRRNAAADVGKAITLREELRRARAVLAQLESD
ncbi:MAG TPA: tetratricopeptide repeat protein [Sandaracinaceae bacterium]